MVLIADVIGPKELHHRILKSKPVCLVSANSDQINTELLDVIDQVDINSFVYSNKSLIMLLKKRRCQYICCFALSRNDGIPCE